MSCTTILISTYFNRFGFVTFETESEATNLIAKNPGTILFKDAMLNIAHAYKRKLLNQYKNPGNSSNLRSEAITIQTETDCKLLNS